MEISDNTPQNPQEGLETLIPAEGMISYIRPLRGVEGIGFAVCSDEGTILGKFPSYDAAYFTARQFHLDPYSIH
jgi:hypothetical protein